MILTIHGATSYLAFQSVKGTIILRGSFPNELVFTIIAGLVYLISAPIVGSRLIDQISSCFIKRFIIKVRENGQFLIISIIIEQRINCYCHTIFILTFNDAFQSAFYNQHPFVYGKPADFFDYFSCFHKNSNLFCKCTYFETIPKKMFVDHHSLTQISIVPFPGRNQSMKFIRIKVNENRAQII